MKASLSECIYFNRTPNEERLYCFSPDSCKALIFSRPGLSKEPWQRKQMGHPFRWGWMFRLASLGATATRRAMATADWYSRRVMAVVRASMLIPHSIKGGDILLIHACLGGPFINTDVGINFEKLFASEIGPPVPA